MKDTIDIRELRRKKNVVRQDGQPAAGKDAWAFLNKDISFFGNNIPDKVKESFYSELGTLLDAGIDIRSSLELVQNGFKKKHKKIIGQILAQIVNGATLSQALKDEKGFSAYEYYTVQIGEETGRLSTVVKELASYFSKRIKQRRQVLSALMYPIVVMTVAFGAIAFMVSYVIPMFSDIYRRSGDDLPTLTKLVISFADFMKHSSVFLFLSVTAFILTIVIQRKKLWLRSLGSRLVLKIPFLGSFILKVYLSRLAHTMALLAEAKIPMITALQLTRQIIRFYVFEVYLEKIEQDVLQGASLSKALAAHKLFPAKMVVMVKVGEEVNQLDVFFGRLAEQYSDELEHQTTMLGKVVEPLLIVILGVIVGVILIAMYLPLFKLGQQF